MIKIPGKDATPVECARFNLLMAVDAALHDAARDCDPYHQFAEDGPIMRALDELERALRTGYPSGYRAGWNDASDRAAQHLALARSYIEEGKRK